MADHRHATENARGETIIQTNAETIYQSHIEQEEIMNARENKQLMETIFAELVVGNSRPLVDSMADDFRWIITGNTKWSRSYDGKQAVLNELFTALRSTLDGKIRTTAHRFIADGEYVVVEARGNNVTKSGKRYDNSYCYVFRLSDGKLREMTEYLDTELVTAVLGDPAA
jgi:uncharacterized protein